MNNRDKIVRILVKNGQEIFDQPYKKVEFSKHSESDELLNDLRCYPHAFVLACIMDRQIKAEKAWLIPYKISQEIGGFEFSKLLSLKLPDIKKIFRDENLHRFNEIMAENFYLGIQKIHYDYNNDASNIWKHKPKSATVVKRFLEFKGIGIKIATMAANILVRDFKIPMSDYMCIEISPDTHVKRVFKRLGFISKDATIDELIYAARELNSEYPGIFDLPCWYIGRNWCHQQKPDCRNCYLNKYCPKII
ncbi:MAG: iron-sulfur cluster loop [Candidatus Pacebacteria bacterium]|nr:iron-sulfur cluster loop [Candidatus Paceibacterota bacterium]